MSWLSQGLQDIGLGGVNTFFNSAIKPALENPIVDIGLGLGATALTAGLAGPEILGALGLGDAATAGAAGVGAGTADLTAGAADLGGWLGTTDFGAALGGTDALGFAGGAGTAGDLSSFLTDPATAAASAGDVSGTGALPLTSTSAPLSLGGASAASGPLSLTPNAVVGSDFDALAEGIAPGATAPAAAPLNIASSVTAPAAAASTAAPAANTGILGSITSALSPAASAIKTAAPVLGVAGLGYSIYEGQQQNAAFKALQSSEQQQANAAAAVAQAAQTAAQPLITSGETLTQYLQTGTLPPAFQAQVTQAVAAAKASIIQGYASRGQSTDPGSNSALAQDLSNVDLQAQSLQANLESTLSTAGTQMVTTANGLLQSGLSGTQLAAEIPIQVQQLNLQINTAISNSISNFAAALNGGTVRNTTNFTQQPVLNPTGTLAA